MGVGITHAEDDQPLIQGMQGFVAYFLTIFAFEYFIKNMKTSITVENEYITKYQR